MSRDGAGACRPPGDQHAAKADFSRVMLQFVLPLTAVTLVVVAYRVATQRRAAPPA